MWQKDWVAASSTLHRVLPREVTHVRPISHFPLLWADDAWGWVPSHLPIHLWILGSKGHGPGQRPCPAGTPTMGLLSVGVGRLEEASAMGLACRDVYSRLLTRSSLRSPGGPGVCSRLLLLVGRFYNGSAVVCCCFCGCGPQPARRTMVSPTLRTPFPFLTLACLAVQVLAGCVWSVCGRGVGSVVVWSVPGGASHHVAGWFAVGLVVLLPALAQSFWWVVVRVVTSCVARERSGCCSGAVGGLMCSSRLPVDVLIDAPARLQPVVAHAAGLACPDVVVDVLLHAPVRVGNWGAACCGRPRQGSTYQPAPALMSSLHAQLHISLHLISAGVVGPLSSYVCSVCTTPLISTPPRSVSPMLPRGVPGHLVCAVLCAPRRVPPGLRSSGFVAASCRFVPPWCPCKCAVHLWLGSVGLLGP